MAAGKLSALAIVLCLVAVENVKAFNFVCAHLHRNIDDLWETMDDDVLDYKFATPGAPNRYQHGIQCRWRAAPRSPFNAVCAVSMGPWSGVCDESTPTRLMVTTLGADGDSVTRVYCNTGSFRFSKVQDISVYTGTGAGGSAMCKMNPFNIHQ